MISGAEYKEYTRCFGRFKRTGIKATFFWIGANTEQEESKNRKKRMYEEGHLIGNHTYRHVDLSKNQRQRG